MIGLIKLKDCNSRLQKEKTYFTCNIESCEEGIPVFEIDEIDKRILNLIQQEVPLEIEPFEELGKILGLSEID